MDKKLRSVLRIKNLSFFILLLIVAFGLISVLIISQALKKPQETPSEAAETQAIQEIKSQLEEKPLSTICSENNAQAISSFSNCPQGTQRLSANKDNPLFYCCQQEKR